MLRRIETVENIPDFLEGVKNREERLMGFGHRVYKNYDPRARIIKKHVDEVFEVTGDNPLLDIAIELEKRALDDEYFTSRKLYPNVDFYSGLIYEALEIPTEMFTVMFAIPRTSGWIAQWLEMIDDPEQKIARPRQIYTGARDATTSPIERARGPGEDHRRAAAPPEAPAPRRLESRLVSASVLRSRFKLTVQARGQGFDAQNFDDLDVRAVEALETRGARPPRPRRSTRFGLDAAHLRGRATGSAAAHRDLERRLAARIGRRGRRDGRRDARPLHRRRDPLHPSSRAATRSAFDAVRRRLS